MEKWFLSRQKANLRAILSSSSSFPSSIILIVFLYLFISCQTSPAVWSLTSLLKCQRIPSSYYYFILSCVLGCSWLVLRIASVLLRGLEGRAKQSKHSLKVMLLQSKLESSYKSSVLAVNHSWARLQVGDRTPVITLTDSRECRLCPMPLELLITLS